MNLRNKYSYFEKVAGKKVKTLRYVYHITHPKNVKKILEKGLQARVGFCYELYSKSKGFNKEDVPPAIFAFNLSKNKLKDPKEYVEYRILGGHVFRIDTKKLSNVWYKDAHFHTSDVRIVTFEDIPPSAIKFVN